MARTVADKSDTLEPLARVFREHGYEGASVSMLCEATGLGKGSLYHFYPKGKAEMAATVLAAWDGWFETNVFLPLRSAEDGKQAVGAMLDSLTETYRSGRRICIFGMLALGSARDEFASAISGYFEKWIDALEVPLEQAGVDDPRVVAQEIIASIQGAIVLARALDDAELFNNAMVRIRKQYVS
ncbi:TetR/AcrR family transcriptional regulator [Caulobacter sp. NIBR2454]|uniref:TetR/AcrR family transcriptional regulator n=1 Tax=Caulobacter sp. NIBR2454 TaxID=3015996 RepID=UPI0022B654F3|nr:TetR/AcrR family transcriptional regulator [Caulobacter sp. NIBR2454]